MATVSADRRRALADLVRERDGGRRSGGLVLRTTIGLLVAALLALLVMWLSGFFSVPREVLEIRGLVDGQIAELRKVARNELPLSYDSPGLNTVFDRVRDLPPDLRRQAGREVGRLFAAREQAEMDSYFNLPPERRDAELDRRIKAEEERRKAREAERAKREAQRPPHPADHVVGQHVGAESVGHIVADAAVMVQARVPVPRGLRSSATISTMFGGVRKDSPVNGTSAPVFRLMSDS